MKKRVQFAMSFFLFLGLTACQTTIPIDKVIRKKHTIPAHVTLNEAIEKKVLVRADDLYLEFRENNPDSKKLQKLILRLSKAHMDNREYLLSRYYAEAYIRDFPDGKKTYEAWYLRLKSLFLRIKTSNGSDSDLVKQFQDESRVLLENMDSSQYRQKIKELQEKTKTIVYRYHQKLAKYYEKLGKFEAAEFYRGKDGEVIIVDEEPERPKPKPLDILRN